MVYLDYNATTPCDPKVVAAMLPYFNEKFGNASSRTHPYGWVADEGVTQAREQVAQLINAERQEIIFTSGATEGCNIALKGAFEMYAGKGRHIITCATEHKAVLDTCKSLENKGAEVTYLQVDKDGLIDIDELKNAIRPDTVLIAIMYANNETGVIQPIKKIGELAKEHDVIFFSDATQAVGKIVVDVQQDNIDLLVFNGHKMYGPKGVGAMYIRRKNPRVKLTLQMHGGGHENGLRSGTLNVPGIVGLGMASFICSTLLVAESKRLEILRDRFEEGLAEYCSGFNGKNTQRLPHVSNLSFKGIAAERLISGLNSEIAFSVGSACNSANREPSHVLKAMGLDEAKLAGAARFSLGRFTTDEEIEFVVDRVEKELMRK